MNAKTAVPALSDAFDNDKYRARPTDGVSWAPVRTAQPCDECAAVQHQTHGAAGPRRPARTRRSITPQITLLLCHIHADSWRTRDSSDIGR